MTTSRIKAVLVGAACVVCCIPLVLTIAGATNGVAGGVALWFRRYELAILSVVAVMATVFWSLGRRRAGN